MVKGKQAMTIARTFAICLLLVAFASVSAGCLEKKPIPDGDETIELSSVDDQPAPSDIASSSSSAETLSEPADTADVEKSESADASKSARESLLENFQALSQYPELPNGCEITSLAAVLNYYGYPIDKVTLSDTYLAKAPVGQANFYQEFVGDPRDDDAYGCYSPVIVAAANSYFAAIGVDRVARDLTGASAQDLYSYIDQGVPVVVWATRYLEAGHYSVTWYVDGIALTWYTPEHCLVLVGYDDAAREVQLADPITGSVMTYDMDVFEQRYAELKNQAVIIS